MVLAFPFHLVLLPLIVLSQSLTLSSLTRSQKSICDSLLTMWSCPWMCFVIFIFMAAKSPTLPSGDLSHCFYFDDPQVHQTAQLELNLLSSQACLFVFCFFIYSCSLTAYIYLLSAMVQAVFQVPGVQSWKMNLALKEIFAWFISSYCLFHQIGLDRGLFVLSHTSSTISRQFATLCWFFYLKQWNSRFKTWHNSTFEVARMVFRVRPTGMWVLGQSLRSVCSWVSYWCPLNLFTQCVKLAK